MPKQEAPCRTRTRRAPRGSTANDTPKTTAMPKRTWWTLPQHRLPSTHSRPRRPRAFQEHPKKPPPVHSAEVKTKRAKRAASTPEHDAPQARRSPNAATRKEPRQEVKSRSTPERRMYHPQECRKAAKCVTRRASADGPPTATELRQVHHDTKMRGKVFNT